MPFVKWGNAFFDVDNDGWLDLIFVSGHVYPQVATLQSGSGYRQHGMLQLNQGNGTFCNATDQAGPALMQARTSRGLAIGDLFNDGQLDVVVEDINGSPMLLRNHGVPGRQWVSLELAGTKSNRLAIGERESNFPRAASRRPTRSGVVEAISRRVTSACTLVWVPSTKIDSVEIRWPSGATDVIKNIEADKFYGVLEGKGVVPFDQIRPTALSH